MKDIYEGKKLDVEIRNFSVNATSSFDIKWKKMKKIK